jgi:hypothetical protein
MQPLSPTFRRQALERAEPAEVDEYERLLAERFMSDPSVPKAPSTVAAEEERNSRLQTLQAKLFDSSI